MSMSVEMFSEAIPPERMANVSTLLYDGGGKIRGGVVVSSWSTLEREFYVATRPGSFDAVVAEERLQAIRSLNAPSSLLALLEAVLLYRREPMRKDDCLRMVIDNIVTAEVDDPTITAKGCVQATKWADECNNRSAMVQARDCAKAILNKYGDSDDIKRWCAGVSLNVGLFYRRLKWYSDAIECFNDVLDTKIDDPMYACWHARAHLSLAICYAFSGEQALANDHAVLAERLAFPSDAQEIAFMRGVIHFVGNAYVEARAAFKESYVIARERKDRVVKANAQVMKCRVFLAMKNVDAACGACETATVLAEQEGAVHVLDELVELRALVIKEGG
jgi:hypothetical protein